MNASSNFDKRQYDYMILAYLESQAFGYVLASILLIKDYSQYGVLFVFGWLFIGVSVFCLLAPISKFVRREAIRYDKWFQGGLFVIASTFVMIDGWIGAAKIRNQVLFWVLVTWIFILVFTKAFMISKRLGLFKFIAFGMASFGLLMMFFGYGLPYQILAIVGLLLSIPVLDDILYKKLK